MIQDLVITICQVVFSVCLFPILLNRKAAVPLSSSLVTGGGLLVIATCFGTLGLWLSALSSTFNGVMWLIIAVFRRP